MMSIEGRIQAAKPVTLRPRQELGEVQFVGGEVETPTGSLQFAVGYRRSHDFDKTDGPGQDDVAIRVDGHFVVGILADGVGQSFFGHLAATRVVEFLLDHLWQQRHEAPSAATLEPLLGTLSASVHPEVQSQVLSPDLPVLQRQALDLQRAKGSQAVFSAFVFDISTRSARVYSVGDTGVLLYKQGNDEPISVVAEKQGRWSSSGQSRLLLKVVDASEIDAIVLKSDGAAKDWGSGIRRQWPAESHFAGMIEGNGHEDDVSFTAFLLHQDSGGTSPGQTLVGQCESPTNSGAESALERELIEEHETKPETTAWGEPRHGTKYESRVAKRPRAERSASDAKTAERGNKKSRASTMTALGGAILGYLCGVASFIGASHVPQAHPLLSFLIPGLAPPPDSPHSSGKAGLEVVAQRANAAEATSTLATSGHVAASTSQPASTNLAPQELELSEEEGEITDLSATTDPEGVERSQGTVNINIAFTPWTQTAFNEWFGKSYGTKDKPWTSIGGMVFKVDCPDERAIPVITLESAIVEQTLEFSCNPAGTTTFLKVDGPGTPTVQTWTVRSPASGAESASLEVRPLAFHLQPRQEKKAGTDPFLGYYQVALAVAEPPHGD